MKKTIDIISRAATRLFALVLCLGLASTGWAATAPSITVDGANVTVHNDNGTEWDNAGINNMSSYQDTTFTIPSGTGLASDTKVLVSSISIGASSSQPGYMPAKLSLTVGGTTYVSKTATVTAGGFTSSGKNKHTYSFDGKYCILTVGTAVSLKWINEDGSELQGFAAFGLVKQGHQFISRIAWSGSVPVTEVIGKIVTVATGALTDIYNTDTTPKCLQDATGWLSTSTASTGEIILLNGSNGYGLCLNNGNSMASGTPNQTAVWKKLSGNGTLTTSDNNWQTPALKIYDASDFIGSINASAGNVRLAVIFCAENDTFSPSVYEEIGSKSGLIYIKSGTSVTVAEGATWTAVNGIVNKGNLTINGTVASAISNVGGTVTVNAGATLATFGSQRDFTGWTVDSSVAVKITMTAEEYGKGSVSVTGASGISSITVLAPDGTTVVTTLTPENGAATYNRGTVLVSGKACWCDYEMDYVSGSKTGFENTGTDTTPLHDDSGITGENAFYNGMLYTYAHPYRDPMTYPSDGNWTAVVRCTVPACENAAVITFGTRGGGLIGLIAGEHPDSEMRLVQTTADSHFITNATMMVQNATTAQHVYIFSVQNNQTVKVYCDGDLVLDKTFDSQFTIGNGLQIGSVCGGYGSTGIIRFAKNEAPANTLSETVQKDARIDCVRLYDYIISPAQVAQLSVEFPAVKLFEATISGGDNNEWATLGWTGGDISTINAYSKAIITVEDDATLTLPASITADELVINVASGKTLTLVEAAGGTTFTIGQAVRRPIEVNTGSVAFDASSTTLAFGIGGTGCVFVDAGKTISVASGGSLTKLAGSGTVTYASYGSLPGALAFGEWTGTVVLPSFSADALNLNNYGKSGSTVEITAITGGWIAQAGTTVTPTLKLSGNMTIDAMSSWTYTFAEITGSGNLSFSTSANSPTVNITKVAEGYTGTISSTLSNPVTITTLDRAAATPVTVGSKVLNTSSGVQASALTLAGVATGIIPVFDTDGLYVKAASVTKNDTTTNYDTVSAATTALGSDAGTLTLLMSTDSAITLAVGQTLVNGNLTTGGVAGPNGYEVVNNNGTYTLVDNTASIWTDASGDHLWPNHQNWSTGYIPSEYTAVTFPASESAHVVCLSLNNANSESERHHCASMTLNGDVTFQRANAGTWAYVQIYGNVSGSGTLTFLQTGLKVPANGSATISCPVVCNAESNDNFFSGRDNGNETITFSGAVDIVAGEFKADYAHLVFNGPVTIRNGAYIKSNGNSTADTTFNDGIIVPEGAAASLTLANNGGPHTIASTVTLGVGATLTIPNNTVTSDATFAASAAGYKVVSAVGEHNTVYSLEAMGATVSDVTFTYGADYTNATVTAIVTGDATSATLTYGGQQYTSEIGAGGLVTFTVPVARGSDIYAASAYEIAAKSGETTLATTGGTTVAADSNVWFEDNASNRNVGGAWQDAVTYDNGKASVVDNKFTATNCSTGDVASVVVTQLFYDEFSDEEEVPQNAQGALCLGTNSNSQAVFKVLNRVNDENVWVEAAGVGLTAATNAAYDVELKFDYTTDTYSVAVNGILLATAGDVTSWPICNSAKSVSNVELKGGGTISGIRGVETEGNMVASPTHKYATIEDAIAAYSAGTDVGPFVVLHDGTAPAGWTVSGDTLSCTAAAKTVSGNVTVYYDTLQDAISANALDTASLSGEPAATPTNIVLLAANAEDVTLPVDKTVVIDATTSALAYKEPVCVENGDYTFEATTNEYNVATYAARNWYEWTLTLVTANATVTGIASEQTVSEKAPTVTFTVSPAENYRLDSVTATPYGGSAQTLTADNGTYSYTFVADATITVATTLDQCEVTVPEKTGFTIRVTVNGTETDDYTTEAGVRTYSVPCGSDVVVTYTVDGAYVASGTQTFTYNEIAQNQAIGDSAPTAVAAVAQVGGTYFASLADAVATAQSGNTVALLANVTLDARVEPNVGTNTTLTIDLGGYTVTRTGTSGNGSVFDVKSGDVLITNGVINCTQDDTAIAKDGVYAITSRSGSNVTLADLAITVDSECGACAYPFAGSTMTIESGTYANVTTTPYRYNTAITGMAVNQPNDSTQRLFIKGGSFSQYDPQLGDDSGAMTDFTDEGFVAIQDGNGNFVVQPGYNVTFDANGGSPAPAAQRVAVGGTATAPSSNPTLANHSFGTWQLGGADYDFDTVLSGDITLVASWSVGTVAVTVVVPEHTTVVVKKDNEVVEPDAQTGKYVVPYGSSITVEYKPDSSYVASGTTSQVVSVTGESVTEGAMSVAVPLDYATTYVWLCEDAAHQDFTGSWSNSVEYVQGKVTIEEGNTYTVANPSQDRCVFVETTLSFDGAIESDDETFEPEAKAGVRLAECDGTNVFQLCTIDVVGDVTNKVWKSASVAGVTPAVNTDYTFLFTFDLTNKVYTAAILDNSTTNLLLVGGVEVVAFAYQDEVTAIQRVDFVGYGTVTSIYGEYEDANLELAFVNGQVLGTVTLTADQAAWLNGQRVGDTTYSVLAAKVASMATAAFNDAYLLNLDITKESETPYAFEVTGIDVGDTKVTVSVRLTRAVDLKLGQSINGTLKLKGSSTLDSEFETLGTATITNEKFSSGDAASCEFPKGEDTKKFFKPVIE